MDLIWCFWKYFQNFGWYVKSLILCSRDYLIRCVINHFLIIIDFAVTKLYLVRRWGHYKRFCFVYLFKYDFTPFFENLAGFCQYTMFDLVKFSQTHIWNVLRQPIYTRSWPIGLYCAFRMYEHVFLDIILDFAIKYGNRISNQECS